MVDFKCLGVFGEWDNLYKIMDFKFEVDIICVLSKIVDFGYLEKGFKFVYWCIDCGLVFVEVEVEYKDKVLFVIDVKFLVVDVVVIVEVFGVFEGDLIIYKVGVVIWIIILWILLVNCVISLYLEFIYVIVEV